MAIKNAVELLDTDFVSKTEYEYLMKETNTWDIVDLDKSYLSHKDLDIVTVVINPTYSKNVEDVAIPIILLEKLQKKKFIYTEYDEVEKTNKYIIKYGDFVKYVSNGKILLTKGETMTKKEFDEAFPNSDEWDTLILTKKGIIHEDSKTAHKRGSFYYNEFVENVLKRDNSTCQCCGSTLNPEVHHILPYAKYKSLRTTVSNGITLCECCHSAMILGSFHQTYGTRNNTKEQLQYYMDNKRKSLGLKTVCIDDIVNQ